MQDKWEKRHQREINRYAARIEEIYKKAAEEAARIGHSIHNFNPDRPFSFDDYPQTKKKITELLKELANNVESIIIDGVKSSWTIANNRNSYLTQLLLGDYYNKLTSEQAARYYTNHHAARNAFLTRKENGLGLSNRVWKYVNQFKTEIELGIELGLGDGKSAVDMARDLKQYLVEPDRLFRRVRNKYGNLRLSKAAEAFHPGPGVYRSSVRNAQRLTRTENNMSYRLADYLRIQDQDFIVGIEIHLSNNHPVEDICDELKGKYPKTFKFLGWHPQCRCFVTYILKTIEELNQETAALLEGKKINIRSVNEVKDVPENFKKWLTDNADRIAVSGYKGKTPYFLMDNDKYVHLENFQATKLQKQIIDSRQEYLQYDTKSWRRDYFDRNNGGYLVVDRERIGHSTINKNEKVKFDKEYRMCEVFAKNGYKIEILKERPGISSSDIRLNGIMAELKKTSSHNNIMNYAKKAIDKQGAKIVLFEFEKETKEIHLELLKLKKENIRVYYYFSRQKDMIYKL